MRKVMKTALTALAFLLVGFAFPAVPGRADTPAAAKARASLAMAAAARTRAKGFCACTGPGDCICTKGTCDCVACGARAKAAYRCNIPDCTCGCKDGGHCGCFAYEVSLFDAAGGAVVCKTQITLREGASWPASLDCCGKRFVLQGNRYREYVPQPIFAPAPTFFAPPPMMMGGFGGGFGGGRRGGGC